MSSNSTNTGSMLAGRYKLEERIAAGGMGTVWRAQDEVLRRSVAVKVLNEALSQDPEASARFEREALAAASISHPNMANVFDLVTNGRPAIVMELVEGETLAARLAREGALSTAEATRIATGILRALEAAHAAGIVHRDVKPGNVLLAPNGDVKLADLGIARTLDGPAITTTGIALGTAQYAAPEQVQGKAPTPAADLYATGVVLYEMLTGHRAFTGETPVAIAVARLSEDPPPPSKFAAIPSELEAVVVRAMQRDPAKRFGSATEMRNALEQAPHPTAPLPVVRHDDPTIAIARPVPATRRRRGFPEWARRRVRMWLGPLVAIAFIAALAATLLTPSTTTDVPRFTGMKLAQAQALAQRSNLKLAVTRVHSSHPKDTILSQSVPSGGTLQKGSTVSVRASDGVPPCCTVPNLSGMSVEQARAALEKIRLALGKVNEIVVASGEPGVISQNPNSGERVEPGTDVNVSVIKVVAPDGDRKKGRGKHGED